MTCLDKLVHTQEHPDSGFQIWLCFETQHAKA